MIGINIIVLRHIKQKLFHNQKHAQHNASPYTFFFFIFSRLLYASSAALSWEVAISR